MLVDAVRLEGRELILTLPAPSAEARRLVYKFKPGNWEIARKAKKRSLDANAYCWVLCDKIACAAGTTKEEVYRDAILHRGAFFDCHFDHAQFKQFAKTWEAQGIGNQVQIVDNNPAYLEVHAYFGSSMYDSAQMAKLIDFLVQTAKDMDIETMPEEELKSLLESWR